ncbi:MAG: hypothetical protein BM557_09885 [Flavobacterium sp. MedPE-SWcel]|uniref:hypothetical protein n=1 Tax=uncultured Flavobacterium sp. TaxID=165435 RepID=UPI00091B11EA|nr:hypothetical protein [uncultured Flavobacterium sp.]OIQ16612.1 MAG: hypothetical protein BM557_09885 [Flavobacterium sp. MedPE-SWcel]
MKSFIIIILSFIFYSPVFSQEFYHNKILEEQSGIEFTEIKLRVNEVVPIKDVFFIVDTISQEKTIIAIKKFIKDNKIDNAVFYFTEFSQITSIKEREKAFEKIIYNFEGRMKILESNLYVIMNQDFSSIYKERVKQEGGESYGYPLPIRDVLWSNKINKILPFIMDKHNLLANHYDRN